MTVTHLRRFRVRHYECDAYGQLNSAVYLRYMQETAFDASAAVGYDQARYRALGRVWLIHETRIHYLRPLTYGDTVSVRTWVADFGRVRSRRDYEFTVESTGGVAARAHSDWAFVDTATGRPAPIPAELVTAFFPDSAPPPAQREPFRMPAAADGVFRTRRRVEWRDIDAVGHLNNANLLAYANEAAWEARAALGWPWARLEAAGLGVLSRQHRAEYRGEVRYGTELEIATWVSALRSASGRRHTTLTEAGSGTLLGRVNSEYVWIDRRTQRPTRIPPEYRHALAAHTAREPAAARQRL